MKSKARQQSLLIALRFEGIYVADTNYRCSALGLNDTIRAMKANASWGIFRKNPKIPGKDTKNPPREALPFLLRSHGYTLRDIEHIGSIHDHWAELRHDSGGIAYEKVNVRISLSLYIYIYITYSNTYTNLSLSIYIYIYINYIPYR
tara:strand:- start:246 stop:686 length:441 start_codon:yes stop_codon:yes gene_type:complete